MGRIRYVEKDILCEYYLDYELFEKFDLIIDDVVPLRKVFVLFTNKGKKILKLTNLEDKKIKFIDNALKSIEKDFKNILKYDKNIDGDIITNFNEKKFVVLDMIDGREASFTNVVEVQLCSEALAGFHVASKNITKELKSEKENNNIIDDMKNDIEVLLNIKELVNKFNYKNEFDEIFLKNVDDIIKDANIGLKNIYETKYLDYLKSEYVLCHNDLAYHNFIVDNDKVSLIDFDFCSLDINLVDIYNFTNKVLKAVDNDIEYFDLIINSYSKINPINEEEIEILKVLLSYPKNLVGIIRNYYFKQKSWSEEVFTSRFKSKLEENISRKESKLY